MTYKKFFSVVLLFILTAYLSVNAVNLNSIKSLCYSPFRDGQSPNGQSPSYTEIVEDISMIKAYFPNATIRTFGNDKEYLKWIPAICESLSVDYVLAGWTSFLYENTWNDAANNLVEFLNLADSLKYTHFKGYMHGYDNAFENTSSFPDDSSKVEKILIELDEVRELVGDSVLVTHQENWDFWIRNPKLAEGVDVVSIRVIPQSDLIPLDQAAAYVANCYAEVKKVFPNKEVKLTTVGWSTYSSSELAQKTFLNGVLANTSLNDPFVFNFSDEEWKRHEGYYGVFTSKRTPKLFLQDSLNIDFTSLFAHDSTKLTGITYTFRSFCYPEDISLPALKNDIKRWVDTLAQNAEITFFEEGDLEEANGELVDLFKEKNSKTGVIFNYPHTAMKFLDVGMFDCVFYNITNKASSYGRKDSINQQKALDSIRNQMIIPTREKIGTDSVFVGAYLSSDYCKDSLIKYPEIIQDFDGFSFFFDPTRYRKVADIDYVVDTLMRDFKTIVASRPFVVFVDIWCLDFGPNDQDIKTYKALLKAQEKYGFKMVYDHIGEFYTFMMKEPDPTYHNLMPWKFNSAINFSLIKNPSINNYLKVIGKNIMINSPGKSEFSIFDLKGREIKRMELFNTKKFLNLKSLGISNGIWMLKLKIENELLTKKIVLK